MNLSGPYKLTAQQIDETVSKCCPGNFILGNSDSPKDFQPKYVGRSDMDLNRQLKDFVDKYSLFSFRYAETAFEAFVNECHYYHQWKTVSKLDNDAHPKSPAGTAWVCPICGIFKTHPAGGGRV
jgi:hypothetical protein